MPVLKFKTFEELEEVERAGKGVSWIFAPDAAYHAKALRFKIRVPFPPGVYKFRSFEEAEAWEGEWWIRHGASDRTR